MTKKLNEDIKKVIEGMAVSIEEESREANAEWLMMISNKYDYMDLSNAENHATILFLELEKKKRILAQISTVEMTKDLNDVKKKEKLIFLYTEYNFIKNQLLDIINKYEGFPCRVDKTRWLMNQYVLYLTKGETPQVTDKQYWHVEYKNFEDWFKFIDSMFIMFHRGKTDEFMTLKNKIIDYYEQKEGE